MVSFYGIAQDKEENGAFIVTEYVAHGSLQRYLKRSVNRLTVDSLIQMCKNVAAGMVGLPPCCLKFNNI